MDYQQYIEQQKFSTLEAGFEPDLSGYPLFDFQHDMVRWACLRGRAALFADTGLGKTIMQLCWADQVPGKVLIVAPLAVKEQTVNEGKRFGITDFDITNYEQLKNIDTSKYEGVVLDESSILKGFDGKLRKYITEVFAETPYRLSCTATPSPNDLMEFGTQSEFLGIMSYNEMLSMFFIHDSGETQKWRLKGHGRTKFWEWLSTWATVIRHPADYGYEATGYDLPPLRYHAHVVETGDNDGLLPRIAQTLQERNQARRESIELRVDEAARIANELPQDEPIIIWCHLNKESELLAKKIQGAVEVRGSDKQDKKVDAMIGFANGKYNRLVTKPSICGFGMNFQRCANQIFVGLSDSFEQYYQAVRRCWRFGQTRPVNVHIVSADTEGAVVENIRKKEQQHETIANEMLSHVKDLTMASLGKAKLEKTKYENQTKMELPKWM